MDGTEHCVCVRDVFSHIFPASEVSPKHYRIVCVWP